MNDLDRVFNELEELKAFKEKASSVINDLYKEVMELKKNKPSVRKEMEVTDEIMTKINEYLDKKYKSGRPTVEVYKNYISITCQKPDKEWVASEKQIGIITKCTSKYSSIEGIGRFDASAIIDLIFNVVKIPKTQLKVYVK